MQTSFRAVLSADLRGKRCERDCISDAFCRLWVLGLLVATGKAAEKKELCGVDFELGVW